MNVNDILASFSSKLSSSAEVVVMEGKSALLKSDELASGGSMFATDGQIYMSAYDEHVVTAWFEDRLLFVDWTFVLVFDDQGRVSRVVVSAVEGDWQNLRSALDDFDPAKEVAAWARKSYQLGFSVGTMTDGRYN